MKSAEALEDSPSAALHDLRLAIDSLPPHPAHGRPPCVLVGVTCGMSATYVGSQLESALADPNIFPVLVGFNPVERARDVVIPSWGKSFKDFALVLAKAHDDGDACLLNPVVGPEVVTGSTRMKSGSATKIILEIMCSTAIACAAASPAAAVSPVDAERSVSELIDLYSNVIAATYTSTELSLPPLISKSSHFLRASSPQSPSSSPPSAGRILYASDVTCAGQTAPSPSTSCPPAPFLSSPLIVSESTPCAGMALLDASECPPTYGASFNQVTQTPHFTTENPHSSRTGPRLLRRRLVQRWQRKWRPQRHGRSVQLQPAPSSGADRAAGAGASSHVAGDCEGRRGGYERRT